MKSQPLTPPDPPVEPEKSIEHAPEPRATGLGLLQLMLGEQQFFRLLDSSGVRIYSCVTDTNVLVNESRAAANLDQPTPLLLATVVGTINIFATTSVRDEVPKVIREMAHEMQFDPAPVLQAWYRTCAPRITFVDVAGLPQASAATQRLAATYEPDVPTAQLVDLLDPDIFLTLDRKHFREFQIAPVASLPLRSLKVAVFDRSVGDALHLGIGIGGSFVVVGAFSAIAKIGKLVTKTPLAALGTAALAGGLWFAGRNWVRQSWQQEAEGGGAATGPVLGQVMAALDTRMTARAAAEETITAVLRERTPARTGRDHAARVLARSAAPMRLTWLADRMAAEGYAPRRLPLGRSVEVQLRNHRRLFTCPLENQWDIRSWPPEKDVGGGPAGAPPVWVMHG